MDFISIIASIFNVIAQAANDGGALNWLAEKYNAGGGFMHPILASLIIGLGFSFERLYTLTKARTNTKKFIVEVKKALTNGGVEAAKKVCENTRGPVASVFYAGLLRYDEGLDAAEKAIVAYGGIEMGFLRKRTNLDFHFYHYCTYAWFYRNSSRYDSGF